MALDLLRGTEPPTVSDWSLQFPVAVVMAGVQPCTKHSLERAEETQVHREQLWST